MSGIAPRHRIAATLCLASMFCMLFMCMKLQADTQLDDITDALMQQPLVQKFNQAEAFATLRRLDHKRIMAQRETLHASLKRSALIRKATLGTLGAAGMGLVAYAGYQYFKPVEGKDAQPGEIAALTEAQERAIKNAEREASKRFYDSLMEHQTVSGHLKSAAWYGADKAIAAFITGVVLASLTQGQEQAARLLPMIFTSDRENFIVMYKKVASHCVRLNDALYAFAQQDYTGQHLVSSDILYRHFCGQLVDDYMTLVYSFESMLAFLLAHGAYKGEDFLQKIHNGLQIIDSLIDQCATALELVINRSDDYSLESVSGNLKNMYVYTTQFICSCGEELYGSSFSPTR